VPLQASHPPDTTSNDREHDGLPNQADLYAAIPDLGVTHAELFRYEATSKSPL